jgi:hypothetical protein
MVIVNRKIKEDAPPDFKRKDVVDFKIKKVGAPIVNNGYIKEVGKNIIAIEFDLKSKWCEVDRFYGGDDKPCGLYIGTNNRSVSLNEKVDKDEPTVIEFPDFAGWDIFLTDINRYTLKICLIKKIKALVKRESIHGRYAQKSVHRVRTVQRN